MPSTNTEKKATIVLTIDLATFEAEAGEPLTPEDLKDIGRLVNEDAAPILGYESWQVFLDGKEIA